MNVNALERLHLENGLRHALKGHTFKYPQSTVEEALKTTNNAKRENHGAV